VNGKGKGGSKSQKRAAGRQEVREVELAGEGPGFRELLGSALHAWVAILAGIYGMNFDTCPSCTGASGTRSCWS
jgi:hypothetical protein